MSVETGYIEYIFEARGANAVRREFDTIADAANAGDVSFSKLEKVIAAVEGRAPRLAASLRKARQEMEASARAAKQMEQANALRPTMLKAAGDSGAAMADRDQRRRIDEVGRETVARENLANALRRERQARADIRSIGNPGNDPQKIEQLTAAHGRLAVAVRGGERAQRELKGAVESVDRGIISQRYALYDIANVYGVVGTAMAGAGIYATVVGAQFQAAFTNVERTLDPMETTAQSVDAIRRSLIQLQGQIPLTFAELSEIATIGNQMGIAEADLMDFTGTIARFASVSGMSITEVSKAFGGFMAQTGLAPKYLENLGSSLALVSIKSNATEAEILAVSKEIAALSTNAGLSADQVVGLAGAMSSLRIQPERARGALGTYFGTLRSAVASGGQDLENFATVVGVTADELSRMVRSGEGAEVMEGFLTRLNDTDAVGVTQALDALNLSQLRVEDTFIRLSNGLGIYTEQMKIAKTGFIQGAELNRQYEMTLDDLNSQWTILVNGLNSLIATISGGAVDGLAGLLSMVNRLVFAFQAWLEAHPWARYILLFGGALVTVIGIMGLFQMIVFRANAALLAFRVAAQQAGAAGIQASGGIRGLAASLFGAGQAGVTGAKGLTIFKRALVSTGVGALIVGAGFLAEKLMGTANGADDAALSMKEYNEITRAAKDTTKGAADGSENLADQLGGGGGGGGGGVAKAAEEAAIKVRTLVDYVSDLSGVLDRAFELRFSGEEAMDNITSKWNKLNEEMEEYQRQIRTLTADRKLKQYLLGIANMYGDTLRAGELREDIAQIDDKLAKANEGASKKLKGNSQAAIENRKEMRDLSKGYQDYILALAKSGASQETIDAEIKRLTRQFEDQATQLGFNQNEIKKYTASFSDIKTIVSQVPKDVTVAFNADPAKQALAEFFAKMEEDAKAAGDSAGAGAGDAFGGGLGGGLDEIPYDEMLDPFEEAVDKATKGAKSTWDTFWWDVGHVAVGAIAEIAGQLNGFNEGVKALFTGGDFFEAFDKGAAEAEVQVRDRFGALGFMGAEAMGAEFKRGSKPGEWVADGVTYAWDPIAREMSRVGAMSAEEYNASLGEGIIPGPIIVDGINWAKDPITGEIYKVGAESAASWNSSLLEGLDPNIIANKVKSGKPLSVQEARTLATSMGLEYNTVLNSNADPIGQILNKIQSGKPLTAAEARTLAGADAGAYNEKFGLNLNISGKVKGAFDGVDANSAKNAGSRSGTSFWDGVQNALQGFGNWISDLFNPKPTIGSRSGGGGRGYAGGGYTGPGHWLQPAGVVHRGEYVIPKKHVNQRTGLPDMGYVQSLQRGKSAPKSSYATGGHVGGGGFSGPIELGPTSLRLLSKQVAVDLKVDSKSLAAASSAGDRKLALRGSN